MKTRIRLSKIKAREALTEAARQAKSEAIVHHILSSDAFREADVVMLYRGVRGEVRLDRLPDLAPGKTYAYPLCLRGREMLALVPESEEAWRPGPFGIPEPDPGRARQIAPEEIDLVICPCTALDGEYRRLGMGGGYYDRFLPSCTRAYIAAAAFACQLAEELPEESFDVRMDAAVTEDGWL